jgi:hypothetical protein
MLLRGDFFMISHEHSLHHHGLMLIHGSFCEIFHEHSLLLNVLIPNGYFCEIFLELKNCLLKYHDGFLMHDLKLPHAYLLDDALLIYHGENLPLDDLFLHDEFHAVQVLCVIVLVLQEL